jgi:UDP-glucose 4-epimerase
MARQGVRVYLDNSSVAAGGVRMRILVTGSSGFIGTWMCRVLRSAHDVHGLDLRDPATPIEGVQYMRGDLRDTAELNTLVRRSRPEVIVHLAAQARVEPSFADPAETYDANVVGTANLIRAGISLGGGLRTFAYASSETVYGPASAYPCQEDSALRPQSPYAASKAASELLVNAAFERRSLILRSGMGFGPGSDPRAQVVARFIERALHNEPLMFPAETPPLGHPTRDVNYVTNFVEGAQLAIEASVSGTFNISSGREISILALAKKVLEHAGTGRIERSASYRYRRGEEGLRTWLDISKAKEAFGYAPRTTLDDGLDRTIAWARKEGP